MGRNKMIQRRFSACSQVDFTLLGKKIKLSDRNEIQSRAFAMLLLFFAIKFSIGKRSLFTIKRSTIGKKEYFFTLREVEIIGYTVSYYCYGLQELLQSVFFRRFHANSNNTEMVLDLSPHSMLREVRLISALADIIASFEYCMGCFPVSHLL